MLSQTKVAAERYRDCPASKRTNLVVEMFQTAIRNPPLMNTAGIVAHTLFQDLYDAQAYYGALAALLINEGRPHAGMALLEHHGLTTPLNDLEKVATDFLNSRFALGDDYVIFPHAGGVQVDFKGYKTGTPTSASILHGSVYGNAARDNYWVMPVFEQKTLVDLHLHFMDNMTDVPFRQVALLCNALLQESAEMYDLAIRTISKPKSPNPHPFRRHLE